MATGFLGYAVIYEAATASGHRPKTVFITPGISDARYIPDEYGRTGGLARE